MRHTVRPFIKEFKKRSSKSSAPHPPIDDAGGDSAKPSFLDLSNFASFETSHDDEYQAALKAADAVFGRSSSAACVPEEVPASKDPVGRVLPSLIDEDSPLAVRLAAANKKTRRPRIVEKPEDFAPVRRRKSSHAPESEGTKASDEPAAANPSTEVLSVTAARREPTAIQKRWVLKTELKAGQKWQRRLCKAARR